MNPQEHDHRVFLIPGFDWERFHQLQNWQPRRRVRVEPLTPAEEQMLAEALARSEAYDAAQDVRIVLPAATPIVVE